MPATNKATILLTGGTGFIGGEVLHQLQKNNNQVLAIVRGEHPKERLARRGALQGYDFPGAKTTIVSGDVGLAHFGNRSNILLPWRGRISALVHGAGLTSFDSTRRRELLRVNYEGAKNAARLARDLGCDRFILVSTAFLGGKEGRFIPETPVEHPGDWLSIYEESKYRAEIAVAAILAKTQTQLVVLRPAIVVNHQASGFALNKEHLHNLWRPLHRLSRAGQTVHVDARIRANPKGLKNMIPVDAVGRACLAVINNPDATGYFHAVAQQPIAHSKLMELTQQVLGLSGFRLTEKWQNPNRLERLIDESLASYRHYLSVSDPTFACKRLNKIVPNWNDPVDLNWDFMKRAFAAFARMPSSEEPGQQDSDGLVSNYHKNHLSPKLGQQLLQGREDVNAHFNLEVFGGNTGRISVTIKDGAISSVQKTHDSRASVLFCIDHYSFAKIIAGHLSPVPAFLDGRVDIEGNVEEGLRLASILTDFFSLHPYVQSGAKHA